MIKNDLVSLLRFSSPHDYPILTTLVSFISLCTSFEDDLIHSWGTLTLIDIDHVIIIKSVSPPQRKEVESPAEAPKFFLAYLGIVPRQFPRLAV